MSNISKAIAATIGSIISGIVTLLVALGFESVGQYVTQDLISAFVTLLVTALAAFGITWAAPANKPEA